MSKKPHIIKSTTLAQSGLFTIEGLHLRFANGEERCYERICGHAAKGSVLIIPLLDAQTVLLIREYAAGVDDFVLGFPKGALDAGEDLLQTANRELMEEVGYGSHKLTPLKSVSASPGYLTSMMAVVLAEDLYPESLPGDEPEPIEVIPWKLNAVDELLAHPEFHEARSQAALLQLIRWLRHA